MVNKTPVEMLHTFVPHNSYHVGQVVLLRQEAPDVGTSIRRTYLIAALRTVSRTLAGADRRFCPLRTVAEEKRMGQRLFCRDRALSI
jgi:hypothetical protein